MDTTPTDVVEQQLCSPPRRRRSTFFVRRDSLVPQQTPETVDADVTLSGTNDDRYKQDLASYVEKLLSEKEQWKKEVNNRRHKYHDLRQQYQLMAKAPSRTRISYASLSNEDIEFLKGKQNITKLIDSQASLHKSVLFTRELYKRAVELDNVIEEHVSDKIKKITDYVFENSTVEPLD